LSSGVLLRVTDVTGVAQPEAPAHDFFYEARKNQIKKTGKAAIRAVLAELAGSSAANRDSLIFIDRNTYTASYKSFEQYIGGQAKQAMSLFPTLTTTDIDDFYKAKVADQDFMAGLLTNQCAADTFLAKAIKFIRQVQTDNAQTYTDGLAGLPADEAQSRTRNLAKLLAGFPDSHKPGLTSLRATASMDLTVRLFNDGPLASPNTQVILTGGPTAKTLTTNLPPDSVTVVPGKAATQKNFYLQDSTTASPTLVYFTIKSDGTLHEAVVTNNWFGFYYYILNVNNPCGFTAPSIPTPSNLPTADTNCVLPISR
jgi:hypothetical protein